MYPSSFHNTGRENIVARAAAYMNYLALLTYGVLSENMYSNWVFCPWQGLFGCQDWSSLTWTKGTYWNDIGVYHRTQPLSPKNRESKHVRQPSLGPHGLPSLPLSQLVVRSSSSLETSKMGSLIHSCGWTWALLPQLLLTVHSLSRSQFQPPRR